MKNHSRYTFNSLADGCIQLVKDYRSEHNKGWMAVFKRDPFEGWNLVSEEDIEPVFVRGLIDDEVPCVEGVD